MGSALLNLGDMPGDGNHRPQNYGTDLGGRGTLHTKVSTGRGTKKLLFMNGPDSRIFIQYQITRDS